MIRLEASRGGGKTDLRRDGGGAAEIRAALQLLRANLAGYKRRRGQFQKFRLRCDPQHDAAPFAVERGEGGTQSSVTVRALEVHRQATERAVGAGSIGVHAPSLRLTWLSEGKDSV
jgi:hypothetical protein